MADPFEEYFQSYANAFDESDPERITSHYHCPCTMVNAGSITTFDTRASLLRNMEALLRYNEAEGYDHSAASAFRVDQQARNLAIVDVRWRVYRQDDSVLWDWGNSYNLVDYGAGWKILVSTTHEAS